MCLNKLIFAIQSVSEFLILLFAAGVRDVFELKIPPFNWC